MNRKHIIYVLLYYLAYFTSHVFKNYLCCSRYQGFNPFYGWIMFCWMSIPHFIYLLINWWIFGLFPPVAIMNNVHWMLVSVQVLVWTHSIISLSYIPRSGNARSYDISILVFFKIHDTLFQSPCTILHSHQQSTRLSQTFQIDKCFKMFYLILWPRMW